MSDSKKKQVIEELYKLCKRRKNFVFSNEDVKDISKKVGFGNPFDATKIDNINKIPDLLKKDDYALIHIGNGKHMFLKGINNVYHQFEPIPNENIIEWTYKKSLLNQYNSSESNILSVANNQRILHHFLLGQDNEFENVDISERPKTYFPHRTKTTLEYYIGKNKIKLENIQIEIDLTIEYKGTIGIFEAKNGSPDSFSIYQLYHPFLYYQNANKDSSIKGKIKQIYGIYVVRQKLKNYDTLKLWKYTFTKPNSMNSISLIECKQYNLVPR